MTRRRVLRGLGMGVGAGILVSCGAPAVQRDLSRPLQPALRVASFNVRYVNLTERGQSGGRSLQEWTQRRHRVLPVLRAMDADILGFQEMESWDGTAQNGTPVQRTWLTQQMPDYGVAVGTTADGRDSSQPIFYRRSRYVALEEGVHPIQTDDPTHPEISAFAGYSDLITWARLRDRVTGEALTVINLHLHFSRQRHQRLGARHAVQIAHAATERGDRVVVLGDLNIVARSLPMTILRQGDLTLVPSEGASFHLNVGLNAFSAIDHILHGPGYAAMGSAQIGRWQVDEDWPSDHYPIWVDLQPV